MAASQAELVDLGFTHAQHPDPSEDLGQSIALWLVEEMNDGSDMSLVKVPKMLSCISIARATKSDMVLILNMIC